MCLPVFKYMLCFLYLTRGWLLSRGGSAQGDICMFLVSPKNKNTDNVVTNFGLMSY